MDLDKLTLFRKNDGKVDEALVLGFILTDENDAFLLVERLGIRPQDFINKRFRQVYTILLDAHVRFTPVTLVTSYDLLKGKKLITISELMGFVESYRKFKSQDILDRMDYGNPFSPWPRQEDWEMVSKLVHRCEDDPLGGMISAPEPEIQTTYSPSQTDEQPPLSQSPAPENPEDEELSQWLH